MLPTPPPSPVAPHKEMSSRGKTSSSSENQESERLDSWSRPSDSESLDDKSPSPSPSPSRRESGMSLSQRFSSFAFRNHSDASDAIEMSKVKQGERTESYKVPPSPKGVAHKSTTEQDIFEQQRHSMLLHSYASGSLQPPSSHRRLASRSSQPNLLTTLQEEPSKAVSKLSTASLPSNGHDSPKFPPKLSWRRASLASISDKSLTNQLASQDMIDSSRLRSEAEDGFLIFPDDYGGHNLKSSHAVSGMVSLHIIKATNLQFADKKLLEKKKKVYCAVEVDRKSVV